MKAMAITEIGVISEKQGRLSLLTLNRPKPQGQQVLIKVSCCGVCHTEIDEIEGRTPPSSLPRVPGHQVVGIVSELGQDVSTFKLGDRVGVAWIYSSCGECEFCLAGNDNLCADFLATGRDEDGGYAEYMIANENCVFEIPAVISDLHAAPLLCAGAIGYRSLRLANLEDGNPIGMTGFGASAHLMMKMIQYLYPKSPVYVFARKKEEQAFAMSLGATWAGGTEDRPEIVLSAIIDTTPAWLPIIRAMECLRPGGRLVINAIRKEAKDQSVLQELVYEQHLWMEKEIKSVANVSRFDVKAFLALAAELDIQPEVQVYPLAQANQALLDLKTSPVKGAKVLVV